MTNEEAIEILRKNRPTSDPRPCGMELCEAVDMAISALRQQETMTNRNEPLTLDELREAAETGDPVWLVIDRIGGWVVIEKVCYESDYPYVDYAEFGSDEPFYFKISDYGDSFKAYRQKPEEDKHEP